MVETLKKVDDADLMPLKKALFKFWKYFHDDDFFFIGCIIGRHPFSKLLQLSSQYNIKNERATYFIESLLKKHLRDINLGNRAGDAEIEDVLFNLKNLIRDVKYYPAIYKLPPNLKKYFADVVLDKLPYLARAYVCDKLKFGLDAQRAIKEKIVIEYVERVFHMSQELFKKSALEIFRARTYDVNGKRYINLEDIAQWEQIVIDESTHTSTKQFFDFFTEHCKDNEYTRAIIQDLNKKLDEEFINGLKNIARS